MNIKVFLLSVCLGSATAAPAEIYTAQPFKIVAQLLSAGNSIYHVSIKSA